ncbi:type II toxin-antitoxin system RelE/ParE family toxin [Roseovarius sp. A46]|uniref:type II toxin-antitoxin system RelE/ParE family toxin n=1 Tax=Roseovarius sp. A46 TaxID=2109331 RepID=UPI0010116AA7|nr:type II toxin-antitoxin system RelE/ParE family toxin [Roseovarius sp. A46]RXV59029.1 type II toxin-antitoxin system RelE/ParE family toxin [Roseovarius sp. A46]
MTIKLTHLARQDIEGIRTYTVEQWGRAHWFAYYHGLVAAFETNEANPMSGRSRDLFRKGMRSVNYGRHIIFFSPIAAAGDTPVVLRILHQRRHLPAMVYYDGLDGA